MCYHADSRDDSPRQVVCVFNACSAIKVPFFAGTSACMALLSGPWHLASCWPKVQLTKRQQKWRDTCMIEQLGMLQGIDKPEAWTSGLHWYKSVLQLVDCCVDNLCWCSYRLCKMQHASSAPEHAEYTLLYQSESNLNALCSLPLLALSCDTC